MKKKGADNENAMVAAASMQRKLNVSFIFLCPFKITTIGPGGNDVPSHIKFHNF